MRPNIDRDLTHVKCVRNFSHVFAVSSRIETTKGLNETLYSPDRLTPAMLHATTSSRLKPQKIVPRTLAGDNSATHTRHPQYAAQRTGQGSRPVGILGDPLHRERAPLVTHTWMPNFGGTSDEKFGHTSNSWDIADGREEAARTVCPSAAVETHEQPFCWEKDVWGYTPLPFRLFGVCCEHDLLRNQQTP